MATPESNKKTFFHRVLFFLKLLEIRLRFVAILVITALTVGYWDTIQNYIERWQRTHGKAAQVQEKTVKAAENEFFCPMHPFVVREQPGKCPICGMDLVERKKGAAVELPTGTLARVQVSPERIMQAGVEIEPVAYRLLLRTVRSYGVIDTDETKVARIIARFPGRVEGLMVNATGLKVKKGEPLARFYSPKFLAAAEEYVQALGSLRRTESDPQAGAGAKSRAQEIADFARRRLSLAGYTDEQLDEIAKTGKSSEYVTLYSPLAGTVLEKNVLLGQMVEEGSSLYRIADLSTLWIQIQIIESEIGAVKVGMPVEITSVAYPGEIFWGNVDFIYPTVNPANRSVQVRVVVGNRDDKLKPGMYVNAAIRSPIGQYGEIGTPTEPKVEKEAKPKVKPTGAAEKSRPALKLPTTTPEDAKAFLDSLSAGTEYYECPMHPEVVSNKMDDCPKCGMHLEKKIQAGKATASATASTTRPAVMSLPTETAADAKAFLAGVPVGAAYYECPMHPEVVSDKMDDCPKCGMHLEKKTKVETGPEVITAGQPSAERWAEGWTCPMHPDTLQPKPGLCPPCGMKTTKWRVERIPSIPESAVIDTGNRQVVYVESMPGVYDARAVTLGPRADGYYPILGGLALGDRVVNRGSFLIDAEARLNPSTVVESGQPPAGAAQEHGGMAMPMPMSP